MVESERFVYAEEGGGFLTIRGNASFFQAHASLN